MAVVSLGNNDDALDVVQEAMMQLASRYAAKPGDEWKPLFYRILHNKINDLHRRNAVRNRFKGWLHTFRNSENENTDEDPFQNVAAPEHMSPETRHENAQQMEQLERAISALPARQRQAFMLRCWEGFSTVETAQSMGCSEGSVKTHYSRALHALRKYMTDSTEARLTS